MKTIRLRNQSLLIDRWSRNGIRETYHEWVFRKNIPSPPKSVSFDNIKVERRSTLN